MPKFPGSKPAKASGENEPLQCGSASPSASPQAPSDAGAAPKRPPKPSRPPKPGRSVKAKNNTKTRPGAKTVGRPDADPEDAEAQGMVADEAGADADAGPRSRTCQLLQGASLRSKLAILACASALLLLIFIKAARGGVELTAQARGCLKSVSVVDFGGRGDGRTDDTKAVLDALEYGKACKAVVVIGPGEGTEFLVAPNGVVVDGLRDVTIRFEGRLLGPPKEVWNPQNEQWPRGSCAYPDGACPKTGGPSPEFARSHWALLHIRRSSGVRLEGHGGLRSDGSSFWRVRNEQPMVRGYCLLKIESCKDMHISGISLTNSPMYHLVVMLSDRVEIDSIMIKGDAEIAGAKNTDGVSIIASKHVRLTNSVILSGDDNIVIKEGTSEFTADNVKLLYGKGISIGSLGERAAAGQIVKNVYFSNMHIDGSMHCSRIKTWIGATGLVQDVSFSNFVCNGVKYGVLIDQDYCPASQKPEGCSAEDARRAIHINRVTFENFQGTFSKSPKVEKCRWCTAVNYNNMALTKAAKSPRGLP